MDRPGGSVHMATFVVLLSTAPGSLLGLSWILQLYTLWEELIPAE